MKNRLEEPTKSPDTNSGSENARKVEIHEKRIERNLLRGHAWAEKQDKETLKRAVGYLFTIAYERKSIALVRKRAVESLSQAAHFADAAATAYNKFGSEQAMANIAHRRARQRGAENRKQADPKHAAKRDALNLWKERHAGKHPKLRTVEMFATEVMRRWPVLTSSKVICGWSAAWTKDVREGRIPAC